MAAMLSFILEWESSTSCTSARFAWRSWVSMSEMGSVIGLPTGFGDAGDEAGEGHLPEGQAGTAEFADVGVAPPADGAAIHQPHRAGVARQLGQAGVVALGLEFRPDGGVFLHRIDFFLVAFFPGCFRHKLPSFGKGHAH